MSISLDKLKALRKQAGLATAPPAGAVEQASVVGAMPGGPAPSGATPIQPNAGAIPVSADASDASLASGVDASSASRLTTSLLQQPRKPASESSVFGWVEQIRHKPTTRRKQDGDALRRLLATRNRATAPTVPAERGPVDRDLPGTEIAPGLRLIEAFIPQAIPDAPLSLAFSKRPDET